MFILEVNALKLEVVTKLLVSIVVAEPVLIIILKVDPSPLVNCILLRVAEAVTNNDPVFTVAVEPVSTVMLN